MLNMAVDVGFGRVKALGDNGRTANFPAVVAGFQPLTFASGWKPRNPSNRVSRPVLVDRGSSTPTIRGG